MVPARCLPLGGRHDGSASYAADVNGTLTATSAAYTGVNVGLAIWLFMSDRHSRPRPRTKFCSRDTVVECCSTDGSHLVASFVHDDSLDTKQVLHLCTAAEALGHIC